MKFNNIKLKIGLIVTGTYFKRSTNCNIVQIKIYMKTILFMFYSISCCAQTLHHQTLSSHGGTATTQTGVIIKYSIGQQSVTGTKTGNVIKL